MQTSTETVKTRAAPDASADALKAAKAFVAYIEFFRSHGTGDQIRKYPDDDPMGGYENIVRRAVELAAECEGLSRGRETHDRPARVRAAAPDLFEALQDIVEQFEATMLPVGPDLADSIRVFGKAAIAKATGAAS